MTPTVTTQFDRQARAFQAISSAKLHDSMQVLPEPSVLEDMLATLVGIGALTSAQAKELWRLLESGVPYPLPPVPNPDLTAGRADMYAVLRAATLIPRDSVEFSATGDVVGAVATAIVTYLVDHFGDDIASAAGAAWDWITGLFS
jgi:hypothetical protein